MTTVREFIKDKKPALTTTLDAPLVNAVRSMIGNDYSQLPVVDSENKPIGVVTADSIISALHNFPTTLADMPLRYTMVTKPYRIVQDRDILDLFDEMHDGYALIVDNVGCLVGIVTSYDATEYFRDRAQDFYLANRIEDLIKDQVLRGFASEPEGDTKLQEAIESMTNSSRLLRQKFEQALRNYLGVVKESSRPQLDEDALAAVFDRYLDDKRPQFQFDDLTLGPYIDLFLYNDYWPRMEEIFRLEKSAVDHLLGSVRDTRNDLAHFRPISREQSHQLRACYGFLASHQEALQQAFTPAGEFAEEEVDEGWGTAGAVIVAVSAGDSEPVEDEPGPSESRYAALAIWLQGQPAGKDEVDATFGQIEEILGSSLPPSAYKQRAWWANDTVGHVQSKQWLDAGWRVASVSMDKQLVHFARIKERQRAYIDFFGRLIARLSEHKGFEHLQSLPDGVSWYWVRNVNVWDRALGSFNFAFGRGGTFRVELYIDTLDQGLNKQLFDALHERRQQIESELGSELSWQRLNHRRASRVSWVFSGHITDGDEQLAELIDQAAPGMVRFSEVVGEHMKSAGRDVLKGYDSAD
jgi:CBS domain-containing protein